ncbi:hypothetical protein D3C81_1951110 [compost metagenome]
MHRIQQVHALVGDAFQCCTRDVRFAAAACHAEYGAARIRIPVRCTEAAEGRHEDHATVVRHAAGECFDFGRTLDDAEAVTQPLHDGAAHEDAAFQYVIGMRRCAFAQRPAYGGEQIIM